LTGRKKTYWLAFYLDVVGVGLIVEFTGIWWPRAWFLFGFVPIFIAYTAVGRMFSWLAAFSGT
jgi:hypothetical protein